MKRAVALSLAALFLAACGPAHVAPFTPRNRDYKPGKYAIAEAKGKPSNGSLFSEAAPGYLQDTRAVRAGDIVTIVIDEQADAKGDATTSLSKTTNRNASVTSLLGIIPALKQAHPNIDPERLIELAAQSDFTGDGSTHRKGALTGNITVKVREAMPNGDLFIEGTKVVMINNEEYHLYISGLIRPADVGPNNTVASSRVADAQIEFTGRGDIADQVNRGWLTKILDWINPF
jgi:flagellar L-ring protein precursor FlgH